MAASGPISAPGQEREGPGGNEDTWPALDRAKGADVRVRVGRLGRQRPCEHQPLALGVAPGNELTGQSGAIQLQTRADVRENLRRCRAVDNAPAGDHVHTGVSLSALDIR